MYFQYDNKGVPLGFVLNGTQYFYITNQMGDVVAITESNGDIIGEYVYDEWGYILSENTMDPDTDPEPVKAVEMNPIRYRGYCYDRETGYYYLQSRYYDPSICRFINADDLLFINTNTITGINSYAYCDNDPANKADAEGTSSSPDYWGILAKFLKNYLIRGKDIVKYSRMAKDQYDLCTAKVYYKKSKHNTNTFNITFGYKNAWKENTSWLNNIGKNQKTINNYYNQIKSIMTKGAPVTPSQAEKNKAQIISANVGMGIQIIKSGFTASSIKSKYNKVWGKNGIDYQNKNKYILFWVTNERNLNGLYAYKCSDGRIKRV